MTEGLHPLTAPLRESARTRQEMLCYHIMTYQAMYKQPMSVQGLAMFISGIDEELAISKVLSGD